MKTKRIIWAVLALLVAPFVVYTIYYTYAFVFFGTTVDEVQACTGMCIATFGVFFLAMFADIGGLWS